jgi:HEAT repeat protein
VRPKDRATIEREHAIASVKSGSPEERRTRIKSLLANADRFDFAIAALVTSLDDPDPDVRVEALLGLGSLVSEREAPPDNQSHRVVLETARQTILKFLDHEDPVIRHAASIAASRIGKTDAFPRLLAAFDSPNPTIRLEASRRLAETPVDSVKSLRRLLELLDHPDLAKQQAASAALRNVRADLEPEIAVTWLMTRVNDPKPAIRALILSTFAFYGPEADAAIIPLLQTLDKDECPEMRLAAARSLRSYITHARVREALRRAEASDPLPEVRTVSADILAEWQFDLENRPWAEWRNWMIRNPSGQVLFDSLAPARDLEAGIDGLLPLLARKEPELRSAAALALGDLGPRSPRAATVVLHLVPLLADPELDARVAAIDALSCFHGRDLVEPAIPPLRDLSRSTTDLRLAAHAEMALRRILPGQASE